MASHIAETGSPMSRASRRSTRIRTQSVRKFATTNNPNDICKTRAQTRELQAVLHFSAEDTQNEAVDEAVDEADDESDDVAVVQAKTVVRKRKSARVSNKAATVDEAASNEAINDDSGDASDEDSDSGVFEELPPKKRKRGVSHLLARRGGSGKVQPLVLDDDESAHAPEAREVIPHWLVPAMKSYWPIVLREAAADSNGGLGGSWLIATATVCHEFAEAAVTVLYSSPAIPSDRKLQKLIATLKLPTGTSKFSYCAKIHSLHLGPDFIPTGAQVTGLVELLPRLEHMSINTPLDEPPYRDLNSRLRRSYPDMWTALSIRNQNRPADMVETLLRSWKWSWRLLGNDLGLDQIVSLQTDGPLRGLRNLRMVSFLGNPDAASQRVRPKKKAETTGPGGDSSQGGDKEEAELQRIKKCAAIVSSLKQLEGLALEACSVVDGDFLSLLPKTLRRLEITHCWNLTADDLSNFLQSSGAHLTCLTLNHNHALDLSFLAVLGRACPNLEELYINMNVYHSPKTGEQNPDYEEALLPGQIPTWPASLQTIELLHARRFTPVAAQVLLQSLMMSSEQLPNLRYLVLKTVIENLGWRERANLRSDWLTRLEKVFLQPISARPLPHHTLRQAVAPWAVTSRRSHRISAKYSDSSSCPSSAASTSSKRLSYAEPPDNPDDDSGAERYVSDDDGPRDPFANDPEYFTQGKCLRVELTMGDNKPTAMQYEMDDFMDATSPDADSDSDFES